MHGENIGKPCTSVLSNFSALSLAAGSGEKFVSPICFQTEDQHFISNDNHLSNCNYVPISIPVLLIASNLAAFPKLQMLGLLYI